MNVGTINVRGLVKRGNIYYIRRRVPSHLARIVGREVIVRSLRTKGWVHALNALAECEQALGRLFKLTKESAKLDAETAFFGLYFRDIYTVKSNRNRLGASKKQLTR